MQELAKKEARAARFGVSDTSADTKQNKSKKLANKDAKDAKTGTKAETKTQTLAPEEEELRKKREAKFGPVEVSR